MLSRAELKDFSLNMIFLANSVQSFIDHTTCVIFASFHQGKEENKILPFLFLCLFINHTICVFSSKSRRKKYLAFSFSLLSPDLRRIGDAHTPPLRHHTIKVSRNYYERPGERPFSIVPVWSSIRPPVVRPGETAYPVSRVPVMVAYGPVGRDPPVDEE